MILGSLRASTRSTTNSLTNVTTSMISARRGNHRWRDIGVCTALLLLMSGPSADAQNRGKTVRITSKILGESRVLHVSLPLNYGVARQRYPVAFLLDGQVRAFFDVTTASASYDVRSDAQTSQMPPQIVVAIEHGDRRVDLSQNDALFTRFLVDELIPFVDHEYRTVPYRTLIGHSLGGRFALLTYCRAPQAFQAVVAISPSISDSTFSAVQDCLQRQVSTARTEPPSSRARTLVRTLVLSAGSLEPRAVNGVERLLMFVRDLSPETFRVSRVDGTGLGHTDTPLVTIPAALRFISDDRVWGIDAAADDTLLKHLGDETRVLDRTLRSVSARVGYDIAPTYALASTVTRAWLARGPVDSAVASGMRLVAAFPEEIAGYLLLADAHMMRRDVPAARRAVQDAMSMADKIDWFDETQRTQQKVYMQSVLVTLK